MGRGGKKYKPKNLFLYFSIKTFFLSLLPAIRLFSGNHSASCTVCDLPDQPRRLLRRELLPRVCPIDRLLSNSRTSVQSPSVKAAPTTGLGGRLPSRDAAPFLHGSIKSLQPEKAAALRHLLDHNSPRKPLGATLKARKAVFLSVFFSPGGWGGCWAGK